MLTQDHLKSILHYNPNSGDFTWLVNRGTKQTIGNIAGTSGDKGYWKIKINNKYYPAHRLAWFYMTGEWPKDKIDHENTIKYDNRWINLREATTSQNLCNRSFTVANKFNLKGVYKYRGRFRAQIGVKGKKIYLGSFETAEKAALAYSDAANKYHEDFSRL